MVTDLFKEQTVSDIEEAKLMSESERNAAFREELMVLLNSHSMEGGSGTPNFMLADYLMGCLEAYTKTVRQRSKWYDHEDYIDV